MGNKKPEYKGMGTTLVAVLCVDDAMYGVNIGDSRIYGLYKGELVQLSHDHSYVQTLIDEGKITEMDAASNNSVEDIRSIREEVNFLPTKAKYRVYIIICNIINYLLRYHYHLQLKLFNVWKFLIK